MKIFTHTKNGYTTTYTVSVTEGRKGFRSVRIHSKGAAHEDSVYIPEKKVDHLLAAISEVFLTEISEVTV